MIWKTLRVEKDGYLTPMGVNIRGARYSLVPTEEREVSLPLKVPEDGPCVGNWTMYFPLPTNSGLKDRGVLIEWYSDGGVSAGMDGGPFVKLLEPRAEDSRK